MSNAHRVCRTNMTFVFLSPESSRNELRPEDTSNRKCSINSEGKGSTAILRRIVYLSVYYKKIIASRYRYTWPIFNFYPPITKIPRRIRFSAFAARPSVRSLVLSRETRVTSEILEVSCSTGPRCVCVGEYPRGPGPLRAGPYRILTGEIVPGRSSSARAANQARRTSSIGFRYRPLITRRAGTYLPCTFAALLMREVTML